MNNIFLRICNRYHYLNYHKIDHRPTECRSGTRSSSLGLQHIFTFAVATAKTFPTIGTLVEI